MAEGRRFGLAAVSSNAAQTGVAARLFAAVCALLLAAAMVPLAPAQQSAYADESGSANGEIQGYLDGGIPSFVVGSSGGWYAVGFFPTAYEAEYVALSREVSNDRSCWDVESSDPDIIDVELRGSVDQGWSLYFTPKNPGTATITVAYSYEKWSAQRSYTLVVLDEENAATSLVLDTDSLTIYDLANCPECGRFHPTSEGEVGFSASAKDPSQPLSSYYFKIEEGGFFDIGTAYGGNYMALYPRQLCEKQVTIDMVGSATHNIWAKATLNIKVEAQEPTVECTTNEITMYTGGCRYVNQLVSPNQAASDYVIWHVENFDYVKNVSSSNPEVVCVSEYMTGAESVRTLEAVSPGEATVTIEDVFGETHEIAVTVKSVAEIDAADIGFTQHDFTLKLGDTIPSPFEFVTEGAEEALSSGPFWSIFYNDRGLVVEMESVADGWRLKAVGAGSAVAEMRIENPEDPRNPIIADTMTITVLGEEVASSSDDSVVSAAVEASNLATLEAVRAAAEAADDNKLVLSVQDVTDLTEAARASIVSLASGETHIAGQFDIHFATASSGQEVVINKEASDDLLMTVRIALTDAMKALDPSTLAVWYVADDGTTEKKTTWVEDGSLCFTTEHFSNYVVTGEPTGAGSAGGNVTGGSATGGNAANESVDDDGAGDSGAGADVKTAVLAQTGDTLPLAAGMMCAGALCAAAAFVVARRKLS